MSKQIRVSISFKNDGLDLELYNWLVSKSEIIGTSAAIKVILNEKYQEEQKGSE